MKWIKIDPNKKDTIPDENVWVFHIERQEVQFIPQGEWIPLNTYSHYKVIEKPDPPTSSVNKCGGEKWKHLNKQEKTNHNLDVVSDCNSIKTTWDIRECFKQLRFDKNHHLGMGDIRLTIGMQEEICELVERFYR